MRQKVYSYCVGTRFLRGSFRNDILRASIRKQKRRCSARDGCVSTLVSRVEEVLQESRSLLGIVLLFVVGRLPLALQHLLFGGFLSHGAVTKGAHFAPQPPTLVHRLDEEVRLAFDLDQSEKSTLILGRRRNNTDTSRK